MENIYLIIIIGYIFFRVARFFFKHQNLMKILRFKRVIVAGNVFIYRKLSPIDFVDTDKGLPLTMFAYRRGVSLWDQIRGLDESESEKEKKIKEAIKLSKIICDKSIIHFPDNLKIEDLFNSADEKLIKIAWELYGKIIQDSLPNLNKVFNIDKVYAIHVSELCGKFGKSPHQHICKNIKLSDIEAYMIDEFFYNTWLSHENSKD